MNTFGLNEDAVAKYQKAPLRVLEAFVWGEMYPDRWEELKQNAALREICSYAFDSSKKFKLPEGRPDEYKVDPNPYAMTAVNLNNESRKLHIYTRTDLTDVRREMLFLGMISGLTASEGELMFAVKDQTLWKMFPNFPFEKLLAAWNIRWVPEQPEPVKPVVEEPKHVEDKPKRKPGRPKKVQPTVSEQIL